jgi:hypothetical protein
LIADLCDSDVGTDVVVVNPQLGSYLRLKSVLSFNRYHMKNFKQMTEAQMTKVSISLDVELPFSYAELKNLEDDQRCSALQAYFETHQVVKCEPPWSRFGAYTVEMTKKSSAPLNQQQRSSNFNNRGELLSPPPATSALLNAQIQQLKSELEQQKALVNEQNTQIQILKDEMKAKQSVVVTKQQPVAVVVPPPATKRLILVLNKKQVDSQTIRDSWVQNFISRLKRDGLSRVTPPISIEVDKQIVDEGEYENATAATFLPSGDSNATVLFVMPAKTGRAPLPSNKRFVELAHMVKPHPDWESVNFDYQSDQVDEVGPKGYNFHEAWNSILNRIKNSTPG